MGGQRQRNSGRYQQAVPTVFCNSYLGLGSISCDIAVNGQGRAITVRNEVRRHSEFVDALPSGPRGTVAALPPHSRPGAAVTVLNTLFSLLWRPAC